MNWHVWSFLASLAALVGVWGCVQAGMFHTRNCR